jgi:hypothetical protein
MTTTTDTRSGAATLACPRCDVGRLDPAHPVDGFAACPVCAHRAAVPYVREELWLQWQEDQLHHRLAWVHDRVASGEPAAAAQRPAPPEAHHPATIQMLLLSGGALLLVLAAAVFAAVAWDRLGALGQVGVLAAVVASLSVSAHALRASYRSTAEALASVAAAVAAVSLIAAPRLGVGLDWMRDRPAAWATVAFAVVAALGFVMARTSRLVAWRVAMAAATVGSAFSGALAAGGGTSIAPLGCVALGAAAAAVLTVPPQRLAGYTREATAVGAGLAVLAVGSGLAGYREIDQAASWGGAWLVLSLAAGVVVAVLRDAETAAWPVRLAALVVTGFAAGQVLPLLAAGWAVTPWVALPGLAATGAVLWAGSLLPRVAVPTLTSAVTVWLVGPAVVSAAEEVSAGQMSTYLGIVAGALLALSLVRGRTPLVWAAAVIGTGSVWLWLPLLDVDTLEAFTGASALLLLTAGVMHLRRSGSLDSLVTLGPALGMATLPSAVLAVEQAGTGENPWRAAVVILAGAVLAVVGARLRIKAPLGIGLTAAVIAGSGQLGALVGLVPRWLALAMAGALLLAAGFSAERLGRVGRHAWRAARRMR